jgi:hypothetical protein
LLYKQYAQEEKIFLRAPSLLVGIKGQPLFFSLTLKNVSDKRLEGAISIEGLKEISVKPQRFNLLPAQSTKIDIKGMPEEEKARIILKSEGFISTRDIPIQVIDTKEISTPLPLKLTLRFVSHLEAEDLAHRLGKEEIDNQASGGKVWVAGKEEMGKTAIEFGPYIVFGPYAPLEKGRYIALFRLKRIGEGEGTVATIDTCVGGGQPVTSSRDVLANELPIGEFRRFALSFEHPGGAVETRVFWQGKVPLAVDCIDILQIVGK